MPPSRLAEGVARGRAASNTRLTLETRTIRRAVPVARPAVGVTPTIPRPFVFAVSVLLAPHRALVRPRVTHPMSTFDIRLAVRPQREALTFDSAVVLRTDHSGADRKRVRTIPRPRAPRQSTIGLTAVQSPHVSFIALFAFVDDPVAARLGRAGARAGVAHVGARRVDRDGRGAAALRLRVDAEAPGVREPRLVVVAVGPAAVRAVRAVPVPIADRGIGRVAAGVAADERRHARLGAAERNAAEPHRPHEPFEMPHESSPFRSIQRQPSESACIRSSTAAPLARVWTSSQATTSPVRQSTPRRSWRTPSCST